jgi:ribosome-associated translation inhibitor RaiA
MQILINTGNHIENGPELKGLVESVIQGTFDRFGDRLTRVEVRLTDQNSAVKSGQGDKRCVLEARPAGLEPIIVSEDGNTIERALDAAAETLEKTLDRRLEKLEDPKGRTSFAGDQTS